MSVALWVRVILWLWFAAALAVGHFLLLQRVPPLGVPAIVFGLTAVLLAAYRRLPSLRTWVDALDLRALVLLHVTRFVGFYFLFLYHRGVLPRAFAIPAGFGDILVATMALPVALAPLAAAVRLRAIVIWNMVGLVDILLVVFTAVQLNLAAPLHMRAFTHLPLSLLPTFLVPIIIVTHIVIFIRLAQGQRAA
jgi:hypothetical protein